MKKLSYLLLVSTLLGKPIYAMESDLAVATKDEQKEKPALSNLDIGLIMELSGAQYFLDTKEQDLARFAIVARAEREEKQKQEKKKNNIEAFAQKH